MFKDMSISNTIMEEFKEYAANSSNVSYINIKIHYILYYYDMYIAQINGHILVDFVLF